MTFIEKLNRLATRKGISLRALASEVGFDPSAAAQWKKRQGKPRPELAKQLADFFAVPVELLLDDNLSLPDPTPEEYRRGLETMDRNVERTTDRLAARAEALRRSGTGETPLARLCARLDLLAVEVGAIREELWQMQEAEAAATPLPEKPAAAAAPAPSKFAYIQPQSERGQRLPTASRPAQSA